MQRGVLTKIKVGRLTRYRESEVQAIIRDGAQAQCQAAAS